MVVSLCRVALAAPPQLNGSVQYETFAYPDTEVPSPRSENFFAATLRGSGQISSTLTWQFEGRAVADDVGFTAGAYSVRNEDRRRPYLSLITAALDYRPSEKLRISAGKQLVSWSLFDEIQPANFVTPRDESDVFRRVELGVHAISVHYSTGSSFAELIVVPLAFTPSRLPQGRWDIVKSIGAATGSFVERQDLPPVRLNETQAGTRLGTHLGALEASVVGYIGRDTSAVFVPGPFIVSVVGRRLHYTAQIFDHFPRVRTGGVTASYPLGERVLLRIESVYYNSPERDRDDFLHSVAGIEYALDDWRFVLSYFREDQTVGATEEITSPGERHFFHSFIFGEARYDPGGRLRARLRGGYDTNGEFVLLQPEVSYRLWRTLSAALVGEVITANRSGYAHNKISYFDRIRLDDRIGTRLEYDF